MSRSKMLIAIACVLLIITVSVGATVALLTHITEPVENTFTFGDVKLSLSETTGDGYQLIPGKRITKDPKVTVHADSEDCWLFIEIKESSDFDNYLTYSVADGWTHLGGHDGIYYRTVTRTPLDLEYEILKDNTVTVRDTLTAEKMSGISQPPTLSVQAYAVQTHSIDTALDAWLQILEEVER